MELFIEGLMIFLMTFSVHDEGVAQCIFNHLLILTTSAFFLLLFAQTESAVIYYCFVIIN